MKKTTNSNKKSNKFNKKSNKFNKKEGKVTKFNTFFWILFLPPYGIYLAIKYKKINKFFIIAYILLLSIISMGAIDAYLNPNRILNIEGKKIIEEFEKDKKIIGNVRRVEFDKKISIKDIEYARFSVIGTTGKFYVYIGQSEEGDYAVEGVYQSIPIKKPIYGEDKLGEYVSNLFMEISGFLAENKNDYGEFKKIIKTDKDKNNKAYQIIDTTKGRYKFTIDIEQIISIHKIEKDKEELVYSKDLYIEPLKEVVDIFNRRKNKKIIGELVKVVGYEIQPNIQVQYVETTKGFYGFEVSDNGKVKTFEIKFNFK